jgi:hypothetical protein
MSPLRIFICSFAILLGGVLNLLYLRPMVRATPIDYAQFYFAGQLVADGKVGQIYDVDAYAPLAAKVRAEQGKVSICHYFNRPAFAALLCWPLALLSFAAGVKLTVGINLLLWGLLAWKLPVWLGAPGFLRVWLLSFFPFVSSVALGQDTLAITLLITYSCCVLLKRNEALAGAVLALCLVKPHLIILLPVLLLLERKHRALIAFSLTASALGLLSFALIGVQGVRQWLRLLQAPTTDFWPSSMGNLRAIELNFGMPAALALGAITLIAATVVLARGQFTERLSAALILTLLLSPHTYWQDYSVLAILAFSTSSRFIRYTLLLPWCFFLPTFDIWPMTIAVVGCIAWMAGQALLERERFQSRETNTASPMVA